MQCPNCGSEINGEFCVNCGTPAQVAPVVNNSGMATIQIVRKKSFYGSLANMVISLDDANPQQLSNNQIVTYNLTPGEHKISYKIWSRRKKEVTIMAEPGKAYSLVFKPDWLWGGFKINEKESILK